MTQAITTQQKAFLDTLAISELGQELLAKSDNGYNVLVGSTPKKPILFASYADHPHKIMEVVMKGVTIRSSAAGRYQILGRYFDAYKKSLGLKDFSPVSQDAIALQMIKEQRALADIELGNFGTAIDKCKNLWASLPGAGYKQNENSLAALKAAFVAAGGRVAMA